MRVPLFVFTLILAGCCHVFADGGNRKPFQYRLRQIMTEPSVSPDHEAAVKQQARSVMKRALSGEDFAALAKRYSQEPGADRTGGDLGFFTREQMVKPFSDAVFSMKPGQILGPVKTQFGYHLIKLHAVKSDKCHASHILFMLSLDRCDSLRALERLSAIRKRLLDGEKFEELLAENNTYKILNDTEGFMVWQKPEEMIPSFAIAVTGLREGDISTPFVSIIGFHIVLVDSINYNPDTLLSGFPPSIEKKMKSTAK